jgi:hypothetical protein
MVAIDEEGRLVGCQQARAVERDDADGPVGIGVNYPEVPR